MAKLWPVNSHFAQIGKGRVFASNDIDDALAKAQIAPDFHYKAQFTSPGEVKFLHRRWDQGDSYFLVNTSKGAATLEAHFRITGKAPELWHAETSTFEPVSYRIVDGETVIPLSLAGEESLHVVFRKPAQADALAIKKLAPAPIMTLDGAWKVAFQPGRGAPVGTTLPRLAPLDQNADSAIAHFSGIATYTRDLAAPRGWKAGQPLWLNLGDLREVAQVLINGKDAGTVWHAPYRMDIAAVMRPGTNHLEVRVANLWVNRLIGDAQPGAQKVTYTTMPTYRPDAPLRTSGLIGPVVVEGASPGAYAGQR